MALLLKKEAEFGELLRTSALLLLYAMQWQWVSSGRARTFA